MTWQDAWLEGRTPWDAGESPPILSRLVDAGSLPSGLTIVPGCGSGYDVMTLASAERTVIGIDLSPLAAAKFEALRTERGIPQAQASIHIGDFFSFDPGEPVNLWWDYTFFCALGPEQRSGWADRIDALMAEDAELVTLVFPTSDFGPPEGPPYTVSVDLIQETLGAGWTPHVVEEVRDSHPGRTGLEKLARWKRV